jgi:hypothetical protein
MTTQTSAKEIEQTFHDLESQASAEHISMGTYEPDSTSAVELNNIRAHFNVANRLHGARFSYVLYEEGYLKVQKQKKQNLVQDHYLALRFLNAEPKVTRIVAKRTVIAALGLVGAGIVSALLGVVTPWDDFFSSTTILIGTGATIAFMLFLYLTHERTHFYTTAGDCEVLRLMGSVESYRTCRAIAPAISQAIKDAQASNPSDRAPYLREEMHEHYRLQRANVISKQACNAATRKILGGFETANR